jgi:hypothetical protein
VRLSVDTVYDAVADLLIISLPTTSLAPGACTDLVGSWTTNIPDFYAGQYYVVAKLDEAQQLPDLNRNNNTAATAQRVNLNPDLAVQSVTATLASQVITATVHVCNVGAMPQNGGFVTVRLSADALYDTTDFNLFAVSPGILAPGACTDLTSNRTLSSSDNLAGIFYVVAKFDELSQYADLNRNNNIAVTPDQLRLIPDLSLESVLSVTYDGEILWVTARVCNRGTTWSVPELITFRFSVDAIYEPNDLGPYAWSGTPNAIAPGSCADVPGNGRSTLPAGTYFVVGKIDEAGQALDLDPTNNTVVGPQFTSP